MLVSTCNHLVTVSLLVSFALAEYGDLRIDGGGSSGRLEIQDERGDWGTICDRGFDDDAGDVACSQLGYAGSSDVYTDRDFDYTSLPIHVCETDCDGDEDELIECYLDTSCAFSSCTHDDDIGVTCVNSLTAGAIIGIVVSLIVIISFTIVICICCCNPRCPLYHGRHGYIRRGPFSQRTEPTQVVTATVVQTTNTQQQVQSQPMTDQPPQSNYEYSQAGPPAAPYAYDQTVQPTAGYTYDQAPYGVAPYGQQFTVEQPPPYNPHDPYGQQSYPPQPTKPY